MSDEDCKREDVLNMRQGFDTLKEKLTQAIDGCSRALDGRFDERFASPVSPDRYPVDGRRPAHEETWFCPSCGGIATAFVSFRRTVACGKCRWTFDVQLHKHVPESGDLYATAKGHAEQTA